MGARGPEEEERAALTGSAGAGVAQAFAPNRARGDRCLVETNPAPSDLPGPLALDDIEQLEPKIPERVRAEVESADPDLDQDVRDRFALDCDRPRLTLLGPVAVRPMTRAPITKRKPFFIEVLAYLALREHGATAEEVAAAFGHNLSTTRSSVKTVRDWLGVDP